MYTSLIEIYTQKLISAGIEPSEASVEVDLLLENVLGITKKSDLLNENIPLNEVKFQEFEHLIYLRIKERIPVQYLINKAYFMDEEFYVDENVLIPRPETEMLVDYIIKHPAKKIIDIGTGSGCIAIMLAKKFKDAEITASDISEKVLDVAKQNAEGLDIKFVQSDVFEEINGKFDIIVSNPPYISRKDQDALQIEVKKHEPHLALFVDDEQGISFYEKLAEQAVSKLNPCGYIVVEVGINQAGLVKDIFLNNGFKDIEVIKDLSGIERIVVAYQSDAKSN